jgi:hypothetical protein
MGEVMNIEKGPDEERYEKYLLQRLAIDKLESGKELREKVRDKILDERKNVLGWIQDGLTIGGKCAVSTRTGRDD